MTYARIVLGSSIGLAALAGGCMSSANERLTLGSEITLDGFRTTEQSASASSPLEAGAGGQPGVGVRSWTPIAFDVPVDGVAHRPLWRTEMNILSVTPRQRGEYPTAVSALDSIGDRLDYQIAEGIRGNAWTMPELLAIVPLAIQKCPGKLAASPCTPHARVWGLASANEHGVPAGEVRPEGSGAIAPKIRTNVRSGGGA